ncbi:MAG: alpha/beta fold hydrolase [Caulobacteraceae bacterium]
MSAEEAAEENLAVTGIRAEDIVGRLDDGRLSDAVLETWPTFEAAADRDAQGLARTFAEAALKGGPGGGAALAPASAVATAVVGAGGELHYADPSFKAWFEAPREALDFRRLIKLALKDGEASGVVEARDGAAIAARAGLARVAGAWPLPADCRDALAWPAPRVVLVAFAPSRSAELTARATEAFGFTPLEGRLAAALLDASSLNEAAERIGVGRETARDALRGAMKKSGARRSPDLVRRMMDLMCGERPPEDDLAAVLRTAFNATPAEARAAVKFAEGLTASEVAINLGLKEATVRGQLKAVFAKTGVNKAKDLVRLTLEAGALATFTSASEAVMDLVDQAGRLRIVSGGDARRVAFIDYGPARGRPLFILHAGTTGRALPARFTALLQQAGWRPIVPQRPGYGLTDRAAGDYLATAADDMARLLDLLKVRQAHILARDLATAVTFTFASRHPDRVAAVMLLNPRAPSTVTRTDTSLLGSISRMLLRHPEVITSFAEMLRKHTRTDFIRMMLRRALQETEADRRLVEDPATLEFLARDAQALAARASTGFADEHKAYAHDWKGPGNAGGRRWLVIRSTGLAHKDDRPLYSHLPGLTEGVIEGAGLMAIHSHPEATAAAVGALLNA